MANNLSRPKSRTTSVRGLCPNRTQVLENSSCVTCLAGACDLCFVRLAHAADKQNRHCLSRPSLATFPTGRAQLGPGRTLFWSPQSFSSQNDVFPIMSTARFVSLKAIPSELPVSQVAGAPRTSAGCRQPRCDRTG